MNVDSAEYNSIEQRHGVVALGLSEYTSRETRKKLVAAIHRKFDEELLDRKRQNRRDNKPLRYLGSASGILARCLGVDIRTVQRWLSGGIQSCNANAERVIQLALKEIPFQVFDILQEDFENHRFWLDYMVNGERQGGVAVKALEAIA